VEKYGGTRQGTDDKVIWHVCFAYWITKATHREREREREYVILIIAFPW
jgi:hypothetical protein